MRRKRKHGQVWLDHTKKDKWGLPLLTIDAEFKENEQKMRIDMKNDAAEMLEVAGLKDIRGYDRPSLTARACDYAVNALKKGDL